MNKPWHEQIHPNGREQNPKHLPYLLRWTTLYLTSTSPLPINFHGSLMKPVCILGITTRLWVFGFFFFYHIQHVSFTHRNHSTRSPRIEKIIYQHSIWYFLNTFSINGTLDTHKNHAVWQRQRLSFLSNTLENRGYYKEYIFCKAPQ